jgi:iron complex outermembrane receptor protein
LADRYSLNLGARSSKVTNDNYGVLSDLSKNTFSAGAMVLDVSGFSPFASYSQSFEPINGWDPYLFDGSRPPQFSEGDQWELGVKWRSADGRHTAVASYFDITQTNVYNYVGFGTAEGCAVEDSACDAASDQRHKGFELELNSRWGRYLDLRTSFTHLDAQISRTQLASATGAVGSRPFGIPANTLAATAIVRGAGFGVKGLDLSLGLRHVGARTVNQNGDALAAYTTLDLGAAYTTGPLRWALALKNVTDRDYLIGPYFGNVNFGAPRSVSLSLQYAL